MINKRYNQRNNRIAANIYAAGVNTLPPDTRSADELRASWGKPTSQQAAVTLTQRTSDKWARRRARWAAHKTTQATK